jgi:hypothetical protein
MMRNNPVPSITEVMVCWNHGTLEGLPGTTPGDVRVIPYPDEQNLQAPYSCTSGACYGIQHFSKAQRRAFVMGLFMMMVSRDRVPVENADKALLQIQEYREVEQFYIHTVTPWTAVAKAQA